MKERTVVIGHRLGLHARAAAQLVQLSTKFRANIVLIRDGAQPEDKAQARSLGTDGREALVPLAPDVLGDQGMEQSGADLLRFSSGHILGIEVAPSFSGAWQRLQVLVREGVRNPRQGSSLRRADKLDAVLPVENAAPGYPLDQQLEALASPGPSRGRSGRPADSHGGADPLPPCYV